jgi:hypothetical protein
MAQFARPDSDIGEGGLGWLPDPGYTEIDETVADDNDAIVGGVNWTSTTSFVQVGLSSVDDPEVGTGHIVRYRAEDVSDPISNTNADIRVLLKQGAATIATGAWETPVRDTGYSNYTLSLSGGEADSITDYTDLSLYFEVRLVGSGIPDANDVSISFAEFEVPEFEVADPTNGVVTNVGQGYVQGTWDETNPPGTVFILYRGTEAGGFGSAVEVARGTDVTTLVDPEQHEPLDEFCYWVRAWDSGEDVYSNPVELQPCPLIIAQYYASFSGVCRALLGWKNNAGNLTQLAIGTNSNLYLFSQGIITDITPIGLTAGNVDGEVAVGAYGNGPYGLYNYGEGDPAQEVFVEPGVWSLDTFGEDLVGVLHPSDSIIYHYDTSAETIEPLTDLVGAVGVPTAAGLVVTPERFLVALGADGDPRLVHWATQESLTDWALNDDTNLAGDFTLPGEGILMCGRRGRNETLLFTDQDLFSMQFIGGTLVYAFKQVGSKCGVISRNAVAIVDGKAIWMGQRGFFVYDGYVRTLDSEVSDYVFKDFNRTQRHKCWALTLTNFGEVWFFYPSANSAEPDRYVIYNYVENHWTNGTLTRTAGIDRGAFEYPMMTNLSYVHQHEVGYDHDGETPYLESGPIEVGDGDRVLVLKQLIPDESTQAGQALGSVRARITSRLFPTGVESTHGPYTLANPTDIRITARQLKLKIEEITEGEWRVGVLRLDGEPGGRR